MSSDPVEEIKRRTQRYWYVDGLSEIGAGCVLIVLGLLYVVVALTSNPSVRNWLLGLGQPLVVLAGFIGIRKVVSTLKERVTYPRTGYVAYRTRTPLQRRRSFWIAMGTAIGVSLLTALLTTVASAYISSDIMPAITGGLVTVFVVYLGYTLGLSRFYFLGAYTFILGMLTWALSLGDVWSNAFFFAGFGLGWVASGAFTLANYLRNTKPAIEEGE